MVSSDVAGLGLIILFNYLFLYRSRRTRIISIMILLFTGIFSFTMDLVSNYISVSLILISLVLFLVNMIGGNGRNEQT